MASDPRHDKSKDKPKDKDLDLEGTLNVPEDMPEEQPASSKKPETPEESPAVDGTDSAKVPSEPTVQRPAEGLEKSIGPEGTVDSEALRKKTIIEQPSFLRDQTIVGEPSSFLRDQTIDGDPTFLREKTFLANPDVGCTVDFRDLPEEDRQMWDHIMAQVRTGTKQQERGAHDSKSAGMESNLLILSRTLLDPKAAPSEPGLHPDYEIVKLLGRGGMGTVYAARQASLDRTVAVKIIQPLEEEQKKGFESSGRLAVAERLRREQFLSEAVVTGDLDHPNIVPIHDVAKTHEGDLFYSMKQVEGTPWSEVIDSKTIEENLEILLKVADAVAFAHSRGVVHRDIKPENVMLGEFGVVMLMDWGLAVPTAEFKKAGSLLQTTSLGGSPAYMAPELAVGPIDRINPSSDIYLLGATLFQVVAGQPPHTGTNVSQCLRAAAENRIVAVDKERQGELYNIAIKAMATLQVDRYESVQQFQVALREYRSHLESISLAERAADDLRRGHQTRDYTDFSRAVFGFEEALDLWSENQSAQVGLVQSRLAYAAAANEKEDFDLGLSLLDEQEPDHQETVLLLRKGQDERNSRRTRLKLFRQVAVALVAVIIVGGGAALATITQQLAANRRNLAEIVRVQGTAAQAEERAARANAEAAEAEERARVAVDEAETKVAEAEMTVAAAETKVGEAEMLAMVAEQQAETARAAAKKAEDDATVAVEMARKQEDEAKKAAEDAMKAAQEAQKLAMDAEQQRQDALRERAQALKDRELAQAEREAARADALYEEYISQIGLARTRIEQNQYDEARRVLVEIRNQRDSAEPLGWEWQRLWYEVNQSQVEQTTDQGIQDGRDVTFSDSGRAALVTFENGRLGLISLTEGQENEYRDVSDEFPATAATLSADERLLATARPDGVIRIRDLEADRVVKQLSGHTNEVSALAFIADGLLLSASFDATIRLWNLETAEEIDLCWHISPVRAFTVARSGSGYIVAAAVSDERSGQVVLWEVQPDSSGDAFTRKADFLEHKMPVDAVALSGDGRTVASGDRSGRILLWNWSDVGPLDYGRAIGRAVAAIRAGQSAQPVVPAAGRIPYRELVDRDMASMGLQLTTTASRFRAHSDAVQRLRFSNDGTALVSASDDFTLKVWNLTTGQPLKTLRGHGGRVRGADFSPADHNLVLSSGSGGVRTWNVATYGESVLYRPEARPGSDQVQAHIDEIWSAAFDKTGQRIVTASRDHTARVLELDPESLIFREVALLEESDAGVLREGGEFVSLFMAVDAANRRLFVGGADGAIRVWNVERATEVAVLPGTGLNTSFAISDDGTLVLSGSSDPDVKALVWSFDAQGNPEQRWKLGEHVEAVTAFAISPDGKLLFTGDRQGEGILWDAETGRKSGASLQQHRGARINAAVFSPDGQELLIASDDQSVSRLNLERREVTERLPHSGFVTDLSISPDGRHLLSVSQTSSREETRSELFHWKLSTAPPSSSTPAVIDETVVRRGSNRPVEEESHIRSVRFGQASGLASSTYADAGGRQSRVKVWRVSSDVGAEEVQVFEFPRTIVAAEMVVPLPGNRMLSLNGDAVLLWDTVTLGHLRSYRAHAAVTQASFSSDGRFVATGSRSVKIWDLATRKSVFKLEFPHKGAVRTVRFSPAGTSFLFATGGDDGIVKLWDWDPQTMTAEEVRSFEGAGGPVRRVRFSRDGALLLAVGDRGFAAIWRTDGTGEPLRLQAPAQESINYLSCALSSDGRWVLVGGSDRIVRAWRIDQVDGVPSASLLKRFQGHADQIDDVVFLEPAAGEWESFRVVTASRDKSARVWDPKLNTEQQPREILALRRHALGVTAIDAARHGKLLMTASLDGSVILWPTRDD